MKFTIKEVKPKIFLFECDNSYDLAMTFLRYQETYESPKFRNKSFTIIEFMEWYSKTQGLKNHGVEAFSYPMDWAGFNIPSSIFNQFDITEMEDRNKYDDFMFESYDMITTEYYSNNEPFYIIGATKGSTQTLNHELAHGYFYTNPKYKKEMTKLVKALPQDKVEKYKKYLLDIGYHKQVLTDEIQAYLSTGVSKAMKSEMKGFTKPFQDVFKKYNDV